MWMSHPHPLNQHERHSKNQAEIMPTAAALRIHFTLITPLHDHPHKSNQKNQLAARNYYDGLCSNSAEH